MELANDKSIIYYKNRKKSILICILDFKRGKSKLNFGIHFYFHFL